MSTTTVHKVSTKSQDGEAVQWEGTKEQSLLLQENGWILGAAFGDSKDLSGSAILRGHVGIPGSSYALAYPGDYIVRINDVLSVVPEDVFTENFDVGGEETLENDFVEEVLPEYASHPTGEQARPPEQMPMGTVEPGPETLDTNWKALEDLAATADGEDEAAAEAAVAQLTTELQSLGVDTDSHPADTWMEMVETTHADVDAAKAEAAGTVEESGTEEANA